MAKKNLRELIGEIKSSQDIVDYIQAAAVSLKPSSAGKFKGLCPFHGEKSPSFYVDSNFQNYRCFGCQANGDIVNFVQEYENLSFIESVKKLAELSGLEYQLEDSEPTFNFRAIRDCVAAAHKFYGAHFAKLSEDHKAKQEVTEVRGLPLDGMDYGYAPDGRQTLYKYLSGKGFSDEIILQAGVCSQFEGNPKLYDFWHGRLMFTITDPAGKPVGFSGRKLNEEDKRGKYVNSSDGPIFDKSSVLFHQSEAKQEAKKAGVLYVAEGQFDVAAIAASGRPNVVASSGTAFTRKQVLMCSRMVGESGRVVFTFDGDDAGQKAAYKIFSIADELQGQCYVVSLPEGQDPCDFRKEHGPEALQKYLDEKAVPIVDFVLDVIAERHDLRDPAQAASYLSEAAVVLKSVTSPALRSTYAKRVALRSLMSISAVEEAIESAKSSKELPKRAPRPSEEEEQEAVSRRSDFLTNSQKEEKFLADLDSNSLKEAYARLLQLCLHQRSLIPEFLKLKEAPKPFLGIAREIAKLEPGKPIIPENSRAPMILETVIAQDYFPHLKLMDEDDIADLFESISAEATAMIELIELKRNSRKIMDVLRDSSDPELLRMATTEEAND